MTRRRLLALGQVVLVEIAVLAYVTVALATAPHASDSDFGKYYASLQLFRQGKDIYTPVPADTVGSLPDGLWITRDTLHPNLSPPMQTLYLMPLSALPFRAAFFVWSAISLLCAIATVALIGNTIPAQGDGAGQMLILIAMLLLYYPTLANARLGQVAMVLALLLAVVWRAGRNGDDKLAGIALGIAVTIKPFAGLIVLLLLIRRRWRVLLWCTLAALCAALASLLAFGLDTHLEYLRVLGSVSWYGANWNASLLGFLTRFLGGAQNTPVIDTPRLAFGLNYGLALLVLVALGWLVWPRGTGSQETTYDLGFGLALVAMLLISPLGWMYYFPVLLLLAGLPAWRATGFPGAGRVRGGLVIAWLLSAVPIPLRRPQTYSHALASLSWASVYFYSLVAVGVILGVMQYRISHTSRQPHLRRRLCSRQ